MNEKNEWQYFQVSYNVKLTINLEHEVMINFRLLKSFCLELNFCGTLVENGLPQHQQKRCVGYIKIKSLLTTFGLGNKYWEVELSVWQSDISVTIQIMRSLMSSIVVLFSFIPQSKHVLNKEKELFLGHFFCLDAL